MFDTRNITNHYAPDKIVEQRRVSKLWLYTKHKEIVSTVFKL